MRGEGWREGRKEKEHSLSLIRVESSLHPIARPGKQVGSCQVRVHVSSNRVINPSTLTQLIYINGSYLSTLTQPI